MRANEEFSVPGLGMSTALSSACLGFRDTERASMTIHFAAARKGASSPLVRALTRLPIGPAANDNNSESGNEVLLEAALRHFSIHGLGAAREARRQAQAAFFAGKREAYDRWLQLCRILDRRMADQLARNTAVAKSED